jgi:hypothetical protein
MNKLFDIVNNENIHLLYTNLLASTHNKLYGAYFFDEGYGPSILLDKSLDEPGCSRLHKCVLGEELGHYFTAPKSNLLHLYGSCSADYLARVQNGKDELNALKWATDFLMPNNLFNQAIEEGCQSVCDLAEWFSVTPWLVYRKLGIIKAKYREMGIKMKSRDYFKVKLI